MSTPSLRTTTSPVALFGTSGSVASAALAAHTGIEARLPSEPAVATAERPALSTATLPLFELLLVHRAAERHAQAVETWHTTDREAQARWREMSALDEADADPDQLPDPGPYPALPEAPLGIEPPLAARLSPDEIAAEIAMGRDPYATGAETGATRRRADDPNRGPLQLQAALRLAAVLGDEAGLARLFAPGAAAVIETGAADLVEPVTALLKGDLAALAQTSARRTLSPLLALRESLVANAGTEDEDCAPDELSLSEVAAQAYQKAFAYLTAQTAPRRGPELVGALGPAGWPTGRRSFLRLRPTFIVIRAEDARSTYGLERQQEAIAAALQGEAPMLVVVASRQELPGTYRESALPVLSLPPLGPDLLLRHLRVSHSSTGEIAEAEVRMRLPAADLFAGVSPDDLVLALREPSALLVAEALARRVGHKASREAAPTLEALPLPAPLKEELLDLVATFQAWRRGELSWNQLDSGLLLSGPPGTGKTTMVAALARSMGVPLIEGSYSVWQSAGHLGDYQKAVRRDFARAAATPGGALVLVDEVDAFGTRSAANGHGADYGRKVLATLLEVVDGVTSRKGVVIVGTTNFAEVIDPALLRPGRLGRRLHVPAPTTAELPAVIRFHLGASLPDLGATPDRPPSPGMWRLAQRASGLTPAEIMELVRQGRKRARRAGRGLVQADLLAALAEVRPGLPQALRHRAAIHEAGHAVAHAALGLARPTALRLTPEGGQVEFAQHPPHLTAREHHCEIVALLAGRAAERLVLGAISSGAGGDDTSDLARATRLALAIETSLGLGADGPVWSGLAGREPAFAFRNEPQLKARVRSRLEAAEREAGDLLTRHMGVLDRLARKLMAQDLVEGRELHEALAPCRWAGSHERRPDEPQAAGPLARPMPPTSPVCYGPGGGNDDPAAAWPAG